MLNYNRIIKMEFRKSDIDFRDSKNLALSLLFYKFASEKYGIKPELAVENIILKDDSEIPNILKEGIQELIPKDNENKLRYEAFHDIFDLIDFEDKNLVLILKIIAKLEIKGEDAYNDIFREFALDEYSSRFDVATELLSEIIAENFKSIDKLYNPYCDYGSLILKLNNDANVDMFYGAQNIRENYIISKMMLLVNDIDYNRFLIKDFNPVEYNPFEEKFQVSASLFPIPDQFSKQSKLQNFKFVEDSINHLARDGMIGVVGFEGITYSPREKPLRKFLIDNNYLDAVIRIESIPNMFIFIIKNDCENILFVNAETKTSRSERRLKIDKKSDIIDIFNGRREVETKSRKVGLDEIRANDYNLNLIRYVDTDPVEDVDIVETIKRITAIKNRLDSTYHKIKSKNNSLIHVWFEEFKNDVENGEIRISEEPFSNENISLTDNPDNSENLCVVTNHPLELSGLFEVLADKLVPTHGKGVYKFLALSAIDYLKDNPDEFEGLSNHIIKNVGKLIDEVPCFDYSNNSQSRRFRKLVKDVLSSETYDKYIDEPLRGRQMTLTGV